MTCVFQIIKGGAGGGGKRAGMRVCVCVVSIFALFRSSTGCSRVRVIVCGIDCLMDIYKV